jgi:hypothetical protein
MPMKNEERLSIRTIGLIPHSLKEDLTVQLWNNTNTRFSVHSGYWRKVRNQVQRLQKSLLRQGQIHRSIYSAQKADKVQME